MRCDQHACKAHFSKRKFGGHLQVAFVLLKQGSKERFRRWRMANMFHLHPVDTVKWQFDQTQFQSAVRLLGGGASVHSPW